MAEGLRKQENIESEESQEYASENESSSGKAVSDAYQDVNLWKNQQAPKSLRDLDFTNPFEKKSLSNADAAAPNKMSERELQSATGDIVHFISKRNDFGTEYQRNQIEKLMSRAMNSGDLEGLVKRVNDQLAQNGSSYKLEVESKDSVEKYGHWGMSGSNPATMEIKHPVWISDYDKVTPRANVFLKDTGSGRVEDGITCSGESHRNYHPKPRGASAVPGWVSVPETDPVHGRYRESNGRENGELSLWKYIIPKPIPNSSDPRASDR